MYSVCYRISKYDGECVAFVPLLPASGIIQMLPYNLPTVCLAAIPVFR